VDFGAQEAAVSVPKQYGTQHPSTGGGKTAIIVILLVVGLTAGLCCAGICGGLAFFYTTVDVARLAEGKLQNDDAEPTAPSGVNDWIMRAQMSRAYTQALDAVTADKNVIAALGDTIESPNDPSNLFRRTNSGQLQGEETIEFDIKGQRGSAVVTVVCAPAPYSPPGGMPGGFEGGYQPQKITVTLGNGTKIDVAAATGK
jgi:hypothetical protein